MSDEFSKEHRPRPAPPASAASSAVTSSLGDENFIVGSKVGDKYEILEIVGKGSMGIVYRARHELIGKIVAVKMLRWQLLSDVRSKKRFEREAIASSRLEHPNIIAIYDFGLTPSNQPYIVMDFVQGTTLLHVLRQERTLAPERAVRIFAQVADALHHAHTRGVIHRDLKPANVMLLEKNGQSDFVKVVDLGIAKIAFGEDAEPEALTKTNEVCGSPLYLSPEQCKQQPMDPRSDMYSLGVVMFELLTGVPPLQGATVYDTLYMHVHNKPPRFSEVRPDLNIPKRLEEIVLRTLEKEPGDRFATMADLRKELESVFGYQHATAPAVHVIPPEAMLSAEMLRKLKLAEGEATPYMPLEALKPEVISPAKAAEIAGYGTATPQQGFKAAAPSKTEEVTKEPSSQRRTSETPRRRGNTRTGSHTVVPPASTGPDTKTIVLSIVSAVIATALTIGVMQFVKPGQLAQSVDQPAQPGAQRTPVIIHRPTSAPIGSSSPPSTTSRSTPADVPQSEIENLLPAGQTQEVTTSTDLMPNSHGKLRPKLPKFARPATSVDGEGTTTSPADEPATATIPTTPPVAKPPATTQPQTTPTGSSPSIFSEGRPATSEDVPIPPPAAKAPAPGASSVAARSARKSVKAKAPPAPGVAQPKSNPSSSSSSDGSGDAFFGIFQQAK